jgi:hypothetical protein
MRLARAFGFIVVATAAAGIGSPAFAATPKPPPPTVSSIKLKVDTKAQHITAKLQALQVRIATKPKLASAKATLQADINRALVDTTAWRRKVDAATTKAGIRACDPAHRVVKADLAKLHADLTAAKGTKAPH